MLVKNYNRKKNKKACSLYKYFDEYGIENFKIFLIKEYKVVDRKHLMIYETLWISKLKAINKYIPIQLLHKEKQKQYRENNKEQIKKYYLKHNKEYYENNKEKNNKECKKYRENNKDKIKQKQKEYYENNKDKLNKQKKEYYEKNKELIKQKRKEYYERKKRLN